MDALLCITESKQNSSTKLIYLALSVIYLVWSLLGSSVGLAQDFSDGLEAYSMGNYERAQQVFTELLKFNETGELYYNLGNTAFRQNELGRARAYYERALALNPRDQDTRANLYYVLQKKRDQFLEQGRVQQYLGRALFWESYLRMDELQMIILACWSTLWGLLLIRLFIKRPILQALGVLNLVLAFLVTLSFFHKVGAYRADTWAIINKPEVKVRSTFMDDGRAVVTLHEATKVRIETIQEFGLQESWVQVRLPDGVSGWVQAREVIIL